MTTAGTKAPPPALDRAAETILLNKLPAGAYTCDAEGLITWFNSRAESVWGRAPVLNDPADRWCGAHRLYIGGQAVPHEDSWMARCVRQNREFNGEELEIERPDGSRVTVLAHASPLHDDDGRLVGAVNMLVDISPQKRAQQALREADQRKDVFLQVLGHELRNQLDPIRGAVHLLRDPRVGTTRERAGAMLQKQLETTVRIVDDVMDLARLFRGTLKLRCERVDLRAVVQSAVRTTQAQIEGKGQTINVTNPPDAVELYADGNRVAQLIAILVGNAAKHTPRGGQIWVIADIEGRFGVVQIKDNGPGVADDVLKRIFDMNSHMGRALDGTASGLGIGLSLVKGLVDLHQGRIEARSMPGRGMEFIVRLPLALGAERN